MIIAPKRNSQDELRSSEIRYRRLFESARDGILILSAVTLKICDANPFMTELLCYSYVELVGKELWEIGFFSDKEASKTAFRELQETGYLRYEDLPLRARNGEVRQVEFVSNVYDEDGVQVIQCNIRDITQRKRTETELKQSQSQFRALFRNAPDAVLIANDRGVFVDANPAACTLLDLAHDQVMGRTIRDFASVDSQASAWPMWEQFLKEGRINKTIQLQRADGTLMEVDFLATSNFLPGLHFSMLHDVTERRKLEAQLRQSQKLESLGILAGGVAHDFNNLLTVITGYADLSLRGLDKAATLACNLEEIRKAAERAAWLTRQLLAFSRKQLLQPKILDLNMVIANIEKILSRLVGEDMEIRTLLDAELGRVKADPGQIEQVILNLVINARDSMSNGGEVTLETANVYLDEGYARCQGSVQPGWYVMLAVTDTGHGMDEETQKFIFEPFFTTKEQGKGTGLGLATVFQIIKQSGGNIWVHSQVGVGTTFKIYLPLVNEPVTATDQVPCAISFAGTETILVAEDEEMVRNLTRESLTMHGYSVLEAVNGAEAMVVCQRHEGQIHLLITDVVMPGMSGIDLATLLTKSRPDTRVLYMSGYAATAVAERGILSGDVAFIEKPFTPDSLALKVREVLRTPRSLSHDLAKV
jgi:two-component system cell cycle sensor histidine kinase/response regulator CckA